MAAAERSQFTQAVFTSWMPGPLISTIWHNLPGRVMRKVIFTGFDSPGAMRAQVFLNGILLNRVLHAHIVAIQNN